MEILNVVFAVVLGVAVAIYFAIEIRDMICFIREICFEEPAVEVEELAVEEIVIGAEEPTVEIEEIAVKNCKVLREFPVLNVNFMCPGVTGRYETVYLAYSVQEAFDKAEELSNFEDPLYDKWVINITTCDLFESEAENEEFTDDLYDCLADLLTYGFLMPEHADVALGLFYSTDPIGAGCVEDAGDIGYLPF